MITKKKILLAEDDEDDRVIFEEIIQQYQEERTFSFHAVENGSLLIQLLNHELEAAPKEPPSLLVLDQNMPQMNGQEALKIIKAHPQLKNIPVVIFSTYNDSRLSNECLNLGAAQTITKPDSYEGFQRVIGKLIEEFLFPEKE
ncbi:response regulator [Chitinophaga arvensicola]|uniref:Response regulator receiver protein n=1 Tax=Chitinophaga arvensicola TaxID=29529 RepID=A0A1I0R865_9BACT|nr:response regulator [Chitinophaga arvensicola]SEW36904.1 response regulator receiver protein [Chitinophaga arvensicola]